MPSTIIVDADQSLEIRNNYGTALVENKASIRLSIPEACAEVPLQINNTFFIGRQEVASPHKLDLDLAPYGAHMKGVSRIHATIQRKDQVLGIVDLGSKNGTFLNGERLTPHQPRLLRNGDEIRLGTLILVLHFD